MSESLILIGNSQNTQKKIESLRSEWGFRKSENNPDIHILAKLEGKKIITIDQVKSGIKFLGQRPFQENFKVLIITQAESLNTEAQNALLKTLEEPPTYAKIILVVENEHNLLETVISRCKKYNLNTKEVFRANTELDDYLKMTISQKLNWAQEEAKKEKEEVLENLKEWIKILHSQLKTNPELGNTVKSMNKIYGDLLKTNVNTRLALEKLVFDTSAFNL